MYQSSNHAIKENDYNPSTSLHDRYFGVGHTKLYTEKMLQFFSSISDMKTTAIRHSNVYGPFDKFDFERSHVFGASISKVMLAAREVTVWGTGEEERDLLHVHHRDGNRGNNQRNNLQILCIDCHSRQPGHSRLGPSPQQRRRLDSLRDEISNDD